MASKSNILTDSEMKLLGLAWQRCAAEILKHVDFEQLSKLAGHTNVNSTRNALVRITKKLKEAFGSTDEAPPATPAPKTPSKGNATGVANSAPKRKSTDELLVDSDIGNDSETEAVVTGVASKEDTKEGSKPTKPKAKTAKTPKAKKVKTEEVTGDAEATEPGTPGNATANRARSHTLAGDGAITGGFTPVNTPVRSKKSAAKPKTGAKSAGKEYKSMEIVKEEDEEEEGEIAI